MDFNQLRNEARANIETHLQHILPIEYQLCMAGINQVLKIPWKISGGFNIKINDNNHDSGKTAALDDSKTRLHALALANDCTSAEWIMLLTELSLYMPSSLLSRRKNN
jgi:hypothetical protein